MKKLSVAFGFLASAGLLFVGSGLNPLWFVVWVAVALVFVVVTHIRNNRLAIATALFVWVLGGLNMWSYMSSTIGLPLPVVLAALIVPAVAFAVSVAAWRWFLKRGRVIASVVVAPCLWTAFEFSQATFSPHGTFGSLAYSQIDFLPVVQLAALVGPQSIGFAIMATGASVGVLCAPKCYSASRASVVWFLVGMWALIGLWAVVRLSGSEVGSGEQAFRVALIASSNPEYEYNVRGGRAASWVDSYLNEVEDVAKSGVSVVLLPENIVSLTKGEILSLRQRIRDIAMRYNTTIIIGWSQIQAPDMFNEAVIFDSDGEVQQYRKHHLIPGLESGYQAGQDYLYFSIGDLKCGVAICKDMDFVDTGLEYAQRSVDLLFVPAWDFGVDGWLHSRMAILRGVESGFTVVRSARNGLLTISDSRGRVLAENQAIGSTFTKIVVDLSVERARTPFVLIGDVFGWGSIVVLCLLIFSGFVRVD